VVEVVAARGQVPHLLEQIRERSKAGERVLVTTLTKRLAEDLATYFTDEGVLCKWLHSELDAFERVELLRDLRAGRFDALVGVNLLREGLDLPEVSLVAILDADKEGFLRSETSLMQTIGRAARNVNAKVILYADKVTDAMQRTIEETARRRQLQEEYNRVHGITPETIKKAIHAGIESIAAAHAEANAKVGRSDETQYITEEYLSELEAEMYAAAEAMEFERAAAIRDRIGQMREAVGKPIDVVKRRDGRGGKSSADGGRRRGGKKKTGDPAAWKGRVPRPKRNV
jgi:excinuclease ABC subunit B